MRGIEKRQDEFGRQGIRPVAISVDSAQQSTELCKRLRLTFPVLSDPKAETIRRYHLLHQGGGPDGTDIARPAEFLIDSAGIIRWENFTEDVRVRARGDEMLAVAKGIR